MPDERASEEDFQLMVKAIRSLATSVAELEQWKSTLESSAAGLPELLRAMEHEECHWKLRLEESTERLRQAEAEYDVARRCVLREKSKTHQNSRTGEQ